MKYKVMQKIFNILSNTLSLLLYPLLIPTYGMSLYMASMSIQLPELPVAYIRLSIFGTFIATAIIPILFIFLLRKLGIISSLKIENHKERTVPYIYTTVCFGFWCYFVSQTLQMPVVWLVIAIASTCALFFVSIINYWWKISAHLTALGGFLGGICSLSLYYSILPITLIICILIISLLLMYARIYLKAHTSAQVVCGYLLGFICTFVPNLIIYHA